MVWVDRETYNTHYERYDDYKEAYSDFITASRLHICYLCKIIDCDV